MKKRLSLIIPAIISLIVFSLDAEAAPPPTSTVYHELNEVIEHYHYHNNRVCKVLVETSGSSSSTTTEICNYNVYEDSDANWSYCGICGQKTVVHYNIHHTNTNCNHQDQSGYYKTCSCGGCDSKPSSGSHTIEVVSSSTTINVSEQLICQRHKDVLVGTMKLIKGTDSQGYYLKVDSTINKKTSSGSGKPVSGGTVTPGGTSASTFTPDKYSFITVEWRNSDPDNYLTYDNDEDFIHKLYGTDTTLHITENGTYYCLVTVIDEIKTQKNATSQPVDRGSTGTRYWFRYEVTDLDSEAPEVTPSYTLDIEESKDITFALTDNISLASLEVEGCGIEETFNLEGTSATKTVTATENGVVNYIAKDTAGNQSTGAIYIRTVDKEAPKVTLSGYTPIWTQEQHLTLTVEDISIDSLTLFGKDLDFSEEINESVNTCEPVTNFYTEEEKNGNNEVMSTSITGLSATTFNPDLTNKIVLDVKISKNGTYPLIVKDKLGRTTTYDIEINNIDRTPPEATEDIYYKTENNYSDYGNISEVNYSFGDYDTAYEGYDIYCTCPELDIVNEKVTNPYTVTYEENKIYGLVFTDAAGNYIAHTTEITNIDTTPPTISAEVTYEREEEPRYATITITKSDENGIKEVNVYLDGTLLGTIEEDTLIVRINGNYKFEAVDNAGNKSDVTKPIFKIVQAYTLDEEAEVPHSHSLSGGVCYTTTQTTITHVHTADCYTVTYCNQPIPETRGPGFEEGDERAYCCNGHVGGCGTTCHHEMSNTLTCTIPTTKKITKCVLNCELDTLGSLYLRQNTEGGYKLYIENPDNLTISEYRWTGTDTAKSTHAGGNASDVNTVTTNEISVSDYGDYECIATVTDPKSNNPIEIKFFYTVENFDVEAPSVSYRVTSVDNDSNTLDFTFTDNMSLGELKEGTHTLKTLTGKTANISLDLSREEHNLTLTDAFGNSTEFTVYKDYLKDMTVKDESEAQIKIAGYPINYETDGTLQAKGSIVGYALNDGNGYGDYQSSGNFTVYGNGDYQIKEIDTLNNELVYSVNIDGLTGTWPVTYIDKTDKGITLNSVTKYKKIGTTAGGNELGTNTDLSKYYEGYRYTTSTTLVVTAGVENVVYRYFKIEIFDLEYYDDKGNNLANEKVEYGGRNANTLIPKKNSIVEDSYTIDYYFAYWADQTGKEVDLNRITKSMKLYPVFNEVRSDSIHSVTFYFDYQNDKTWCESYEVPHKSSVIPPSAEKEPTEKYTYQFMYWTTANGVAVYDFSSIENDMEYFAYWLETEIPPEPMEIKDTSEVIEREAEILTIEPPVPKDREIEIKDKATPKNALMNFYEDNKETIKAVGTGVGITAGLLGLGEIICLILTGFGLIQLGIFLWALLRKKKRYIQGAWLTNEPDTQYVDKHGRSISINDGIYTNGEDILMAVDVNKEIEKLNRGTISYSDFRQNIKMSEVYTVFDENLEIECSNIKNTYKSKVKGFDIIKNLKNFIKAAGSYRLKLKNGKDEFLYTLSVAMNGSKI